MEVRKISAGFILYRKGKILVLRNNYGWNFPKGEVEKGEDPLQAAIRETQEETGITPGKPLPKTVEYTMKITMDWDTREPLEEPFLKKVILFFGESPTFDIELSFEHYEYKWIPAKEAKSLIKRHISRSFKEQF